MELKTKDKKDLKKWKLSMSGQGAKAKTSSVMSIQQVRLFAFAISSIQRENHIDPARKNKNEVEISVADYLEHFPSNSNAIYAEIDKNANSLTNLKLAIGDSQKAASGNNERGYLAVFPKFTYTDSVLRIKINEELSKHFIDLEKNFVLTDLETVKSFKNKYAWYFYKIFKASVFEGSRGYVKLSLKQMRDELFLKDKPSYDNIYNLVKWIIKPAIKEINNVTNLKVKFNETKKLRRVDAFVFEILNNKGDFLNKPEDMGLEINCELEPKLAKLVAKYGRFILEHVSVINSEKEAVESLLKIKDKIYEKSNDNRLLLDLLIEKRGVGG